MSQSGVEIATARMDDVWQEIAELIPAQWAEVFADRPYPPDPDWAQYVALDEAGLFHVTTARNGSLVGYQMVLLAPTLHSCGVMCAVNDAFYVRPEHRGIGRAILAHSMDALAQRGARVLQMQAPEGGRLGVMFKRLGFRPIETVYERVL